MKRNILLFIIAFCALSVFAQSTDRTFVVPVSEDGLATLTCFIPSQQKATGRAVVVCPGGAYWTLAMKHEGTDWAEYFNKQGIACFVLKYRLPHGNRELPIADANAAMKMVRDSAAIWHVNPYDVGIMGFSAGGHLASTISTHADFAHRPNFSILFYPVISMDGEKGHVGSAKNLLGKEWKDKKLISEYSNHLHVQRHLTPPAVLLLSNDDCSVPPVTNAIAYYSAMRSKGNNCALYVYPSGGHGYGYKKSFKYHVEMLNNLTSWLRSLPSPRQDAIRIACIGNSITDGSGIDMRAVYGYPAQLQKLLGEKYHVRNYGVGARTMLNKGDHPYMRELAWREALEFNPNIAIIKLGTNDSKSHNWQYKDEFASDMQQMIDSLKKLPARPKIYLVYPLIASNSVRPGEINNEIIEKEILPIINKLAKKNRCTIIDMRNRLTSQKDFMLSDGIHPTAKGATEMARAVAEVVTK